MNREEYEKSFSDEPLQEEAANENKKDSKSKREKALELALDIRKFEIDLYWKRATYFWTFIAAAFAGYALVYTKATDSSEDKSWVLLVFSCLGLLFSVAWYLVNRGSKFWQNNWERHVDLLEDKVNGPLYKTIAHGTHECNPLIAPKQYSVSKINQILSFFVSWFWVVLIIKSILPLSPNLAIDWFKVSVLIITVITVGSLFGYGKSQNKETETRLTAREVSVIEKG